MLWAPSHCLRVLGVGYKITITLINRRKSSRRRPGANDDGLNRVSFKQVMQEATGSENPESDLSGLSEDRHSMERKVFPELAESGDMAGLAFTGYFVDAGTPESFIEAAQVSIANHRHDTGQVHGDCWLGDGSVCSGDATGSAIGAGSVIEQGVTLVDCVVLDGARIGARAKLTRCLVGEGATISGDSELSDQVIGHDASI